jgi:hypothetical protein
MTLKVSDISKIGVACEVMVHIVNEFEFDLWPVSPFEILTLQYGDFLI